MQRVITSHSARSGAATLAGGGPNRQFASLVVGSVSKRRVTATSAGRLFLPRQQASAASVPLGVTTNDNARCRLHPAAYRSVSSASASIDGSAGTATSDAPDANERTSGSDGGDSGSSSGSGASLDDHRTAILTAALDHVHEHGWTDDAIASAVLTLDLPPSMVGLVTGSELISFFMDRCNDDLESKLKEKFVPKWEEGGTAIPERIHQALWARLEMNGPYVRSGRWHEGMALGALPPNNAAVTAGQLSRLVDVVVDAVGLPGGAGWVERAAIGGVYATTELHMLADDSPAFEDTATFLSDRVRELEIMANATSSPGGGALPGNLVSPEAAVAATAVATSLGGAVVSLAQPAARGVVSAAASTIVPQMMTFMQQQQTPKEERPDSTGMAGTSPDDYSVDDLPPFDDEAAGKK